ncbi:hypothetical protein [Paraflavitalea pollutisoli]|uniref:hypothetical protein n=1 Tax=Paraflavitalea pollutisoli TaxID=3034143 RepID=UPI0023EB1606|nr:hypothetical protein [Paraflavitalea sp. H1-2-19X]
MISSNDFDHFLRKGYIKGLPAGTSVKKLITVYGKKYWGVKERDTNGLIYGIIKVGFIEFHIYDEKISGISYRPDIIYSKKDFNAVLVPWIEKKRSLQAVEAALTNRKIQFKRFTITGPLDSLTTAGGDFFYVEPGEYTLIDTEGGVTWVFEKNESTGQLEARQICKYYRRTNEINSQ